MGVVTGLIPVTGLTLPFVSLGGSSLLASLLMMGILLNIARKSALQRREMRIVLAGGGTAGHIFPTLAVARRLRALLGRRGGRPHHRVRGRASLIASYTAAWNSTSSRSMSAASWAWGLRAYRRGFGGSSSRRWPCGRDLGARPPDAIVLSGGYVSVPVMLAGWLRGIPRLIFSGDAQLGWATKALAPLATVSTVAFREAVGQLRGSRVEFTGYPLRDAFASPDRDARPGSRRRDVGRALGPDRGGQPGSARGQRGHRAGTSHSCSTAPWSCMSPGAAISSGSRRCVSASRPTGARAITSTPSSTRASRISWPPPT